MPLGDRTGPRGFGPRTGRGLGSCPPGETAYPNTRRGYPVLGTGRRFLGKLGRGGWGRFRNPLGRR